MKNKKVNSSLLKAYDLVQTKRSKEHGSYSDNFERASDIYTAWRGEILFKKRRLDAIESLCFMQCLKMARETANSKNRDNRIDQAGYIELRDMTMKNKSREG